MTRWVLHPEALNEVNYTPLLRDIAEDVVDDAKRLAPKRTGSLRESIHIDGVFPRSARVSADARNPNDPPSEAGYAYYVEKGTGHSVARPFLRPALYRYRS